MRDVVDVMEACLVDSLSSISFCENVCVFVYTSEELAFSMQLFFMVVNCFVVIYAVRQLLDCL